MKKSPKRPFRIYILLFIPVFFALFFGIYKSGYFNIKKISIEVENLTCTNRDEIKNSAGLFGQNIFFLNKSKIENDLKKKFICIKSTRVSKSLPDKLSLKISNRQAYAILASLKSEASVSATPAASFVEDYQMIDNEGIIFGKSYNNLSLPQIFAYNTKENIKLALKILEKLKALNFVINNSWIASSVFVVESNPPVTKILFSLNNSIDVQLASLQLIVDKAKIDDEYFEFIDLRFDKPVVKIAPKK